MFKIRCSKISQIMGARGLGKTGETVAKDWLIEKLYNRKKEFSNKFTQKGLIVEDDSIELVAEHFGYGLLIKNEKHFENEFMTGTPDLILKHKTIDIKSSWSVHTFPLFNEQLDKAYYYQGLGYMALTGKRKHEVIYVLSDTPEYLIEREAWKFCRDNGIDELDVDTFEEFQKRMTYDDISIDMRIKKYEFDYDEKEVELIYSRVNDCREYIKTLLK